ncbi:hypothetical protein GCK32_018264 [Trichostrongylus colubriformis]|uniref:Uncharacterized protein n=1 Tax=Trichostrongylus colubriformis TaxID=6319 RepID=A0AAN8FL29_TRICO
MSKVKRFGVFPMLSEEPFDEAQFNKNFDFTIARGRTWNQAMISFHPSTSLFSFLGQYFTRNLQRIFTEFILRLVRS